MKLIAAGIGGLKENYLFNCTRNKGCEKKFFIPIPSINSIMQFYADLPGPVSSYNIEIIDDCDSTTISAVSGTNIIGQKPDLSYYGVFGDIVPSGDTPANFYMKWTFTIAGSDYVYYTNYFTTNDCYDLSLIQGCYPNETVGADASDCNGVYYGFSNGDVSGTENYRYFHWAYVRDAEIIEQKNTFNFTLFNTKKAYKNTFSRETLFQSECVPKFYKDIQVGVFNRGNILIDSQEWRLGEQQDLSADTETKRWDMKIILAEQCDQYFGCGVSDCTLPEIPPPPDECCNPTVEDAHVIIDDGEG